MALSAVIAKLREDVRTAWELSPDDKLYDSPPETDTDKVTLPYVAVILPEISLEFDTPISDAATFQPVVYGRFMKEAGVSVLEQKTAKFDALRAVLTAGADYAGAYLPIVSGVQFDSGDRQNPDYIVAVSFTCQASLARGA